MKKTLASGALVFTHLCGTFPLHLPLLFGPGPGLPECALKNFTSPRSPITFSHTVFSLEC